MITSNYHFYQVDTLFMELQGHVVFLLLEAVECMPNNVMNENNVTGCMWMIILLFLGIWYL